MLPDPTEASTRARVLVTDDQPDVLEALRLLLKGHGYDVDAANSPTAVQQAKRSARLGLEQPIEQAIEIELECYRRMVNHPDRFEGVTAFNERRKPEFEDSY